MGGGTARRDDDQRVDIARHGHQVIVELVRHVALLPAPEVADRKAERLQPPADGPADAAQAGDPDGPVAEGRGREAIVALGGPAAIAQPFLGPVEFAHRAQQQPQGGIGDFLGEHVGCVCHHDASSGGCRCIDRVVADAEVADDLQIGETSH